MKTAGIIAEYNPFHKGHLYHIEETKKRLGVTHTLAVMSGNFVMRGEPSIYNKLIRAEAAVRGGIDLVIELPLCFALSSAEHFAYGGVNAMELLGGVDFLSFGSETGDIEKLKAEAEAVESESVQNKISEGMKAGMPVFAAISEALGEDNSHSSPNDILAVNYLKALRKLKSGIVPFTLKRAGAGYLSENTEEEFASAMGIRKKIRDGDDFSPYVPEEVAGFLKDEEPVLEEYFNQAVTYAMRKVSREELMGIRDVSEGLENAFKESASEFYGAEAIAHGVKSKRYAYSRIKRIIYNAFLGIEKDEIEKPLTYLRVLAFNDKGRELIKRFNETSAVPLITNPTRKDFGIHKGLALEVRASEIYSLGERKKASRGDLRSIYIH